MSNTDELTRFLIRADRLATAFDIQRALASWDNSPRETLDTQVTEILSNKESLRLARLLVQQIKQVKKKLLSDFGPALHKG